MVQLLEMWALVEVLGLMCLPLTLTVFHNLPDRGWAFSKAIGVALLAFFVWLPLMYLHALPFSQLFIAGVFLILLALNVTGFLWVRTSIAKYIRANLSYIVVTESIFLGMVFLLGWIRSYGPDITGFEMYMDQGILAGIMRSPHFPPNDVWMAGYSINYYYYAHYTIAVMAKLLGQPSYVAFNTGISTLFGLTAINLFGVTCNIVAWARYRRKRELATVGGPNQVGHVILSAAKNPPPWPQRFFAALRMTRVTAASAPTAPQRNARAERPDRVFPPLLGTVPYGLLTLVMGLILGNLASTQQWWIQHGDLPP